MKTDQYNLNSDIHGRDIRQISNFCQAVSKRHLLYGPQDLQQLIGLYKNISHNNKELKLLLKNVLYSKSFLYTR